MNQSISMESNGGINQIDNENETDGFTKAASPHNLRETIKAC